MYCHWLHQLNLEAQRNQAALDKLVALVSTLTQISAAFLDSSVSRSLTCIPQWLSVLDVPCCVLVCSRTLAFGLTFHSVHAAAAASHVLCSSPLVEGAIVCSFMP